MRVRVGLLAALLVVAAGTAVVLSRGGACGVTDVPAPLPPSGVAAPDLSAVGLHPVRPPLEASPVFGVVTAPGADAVSTRTADGERRAVVALDPLGGVLWSVAVPGSTVAVAAAGDRVVVAALGDRLRVVVLDARTGGDRRCAELGEGVRTLGPGDPQPLAVSTGMAVVGWSGAEGVRLAGVDVMTGDVAWEVGSTAPVQRLVAAGGRVVDGDGTARDPATGAVTADGGPGELLAATGEHAVLATSEGLTAYDATGRVAWTAPPIGLGAAPEMQAATVDGVLVVHDLATVPTEPDLLRGLDLATGRTLWATAREADDPALLPLGERLVVAGNRSVALLDPATGRGPTADVDPVVTAAAAGDGRLVLRAGGQLVTYRVLSTIGR